MKHIGTSPFSPAGRQLLECAMSKAEYAAPAIACAGKDKFATMNVAREISRRMNKRHENSALNAYRCPYCGKYHVGNLNKKGKFYGKPK